MPLIQLPVLGGRNPQAPHGLKSQIERFDRARLYAGKGDIRGDALGLHQFARGPRFGCAFFGYANIPPTGEPVFQIPLGLSVANEDKLWHGSSFVV